MGGCLHHGMPAVPLVFQEYRFKGCESHTSQPCVDVQSSMRLRQFERGGTAICEVSRPGSTSNVLSAIHIPSLRNDSFHSLPLEARTDTEEKFHSSQRIGLAGSVTRDLLLIHGFLPSSPHPYLCCMSSPFFPPPKRLLQSERSAVYVSCKEVLSAVHIPFSQKTIRSSHCPWRLVISQPTKFFFIIENPLG